MAQFNQLNVAETAGRGRNEKQVEEFNALRMDAQNQQMSQQQTVFDEAQRLQNTRLLAGSVKYAIENPGALPAIAKNLKEKQILAPDFDYRTLDVSQLPQLLEQLTAGMGGPEYTDVAAEDVPYAQRNSAGQVSLPGATPKGPTSPMQNITERERRVAQFGEGSPEVRNFDNYVRAQKVTDVAGVPSAVGVGGTTPLSTQSAELDFTSREAEAKEAGARLGKPSEAQIAIDKEFGKEYVAFTTGGFQDARKGAEQLRVVQQQLEGGDADLSGWKVASQPDIVLATTNPEALQAREQVEEVVQRNLRIILGAQFTEKEGVRLIARAYNPWLDEKYNAIRIGRLLKSIESAVEAKLSAVKYFELNNSLAGYQSELQWDQNKPSGIRAATALSIFNDALDQQDKLVPGDSLNGFTYNGGDPNDANSWVKGE